MASWGDGDEAGYRDVVMMGSFQVLYVYYYYNYGRLHFLCKATSQCTSPTGRNITQSGRYGILFGSLADLAVGPDVRKTGLRESGHSGRIISLAGAKTWRIIPLHAATP